MNTNERSRLNWLMVECLAKEVWRDFPVEWSKGAMLEQLMHWFASRDERFRWAGFQWSQPDGFLVYAPYGFPHSDEKFATWRDNHQEWYVGEAAIAAFLGLDLKGHGMRMNPTEAALKVIYREFGSAGEATAWISQQSAKRHGMLTRDYMKTVTGEWPFITNGKLQEGKFLLVPSIKQQLAGDLSCSICNKD